MTAASVESGKSMGSAVKDAGASTDFNELLKLNQVYYNLPPSLSLVSKRCITRCQFQQTSYPNPTTTNAVCIFNTGEFQVAGRTSFLVIQAGIDKSLTSLAPIWVNGTNSTVAASSTAHALLGQGNIMNLVQEITFTSASGTEVDRQQEKGLLNSHVSRNMYSKPYFDTAGDLSGYPGGTYHECYDTFGNGGQLPAAVWQPPWLFPIRDTTYTGHDWSIVPSTYPLTSYDTSKSTTSVGSVDISFNPVYDASFNPHPGQAMYFVVPLTEVLGCFNPYMQALIPSAELAGGRLEIRWKNPVEALIATGKILDSAAEATQFLNAIQIYNIWLDLDSYQMNDSVLKTLNEIAAGREGLTVMFDTWDWAQTSTTTLTFEAMVSQARSRISRSFCVLRNSLEISNPYANSLASEAAVNRTTALSKSYTPGTPQTGNQQQLVNNYQAILGSLYFPQQPLTTVEEFCMNAYYTFSKNYTNPEVISAITYDDFIGANGVGHYSGSTINVPASAANINPDSSTALGSLSTRIATGLPGWTQNWGSATYGFIAERSQLLQLTGLPISNARLLRHHFVLNYAPAGNSGRNCDVFTQYTRIAKVFLGGRIVMRE
jgi:hypothetical protein